MELEENLHHIDSVEYDVKQKNKDLKDSVWLEVQGERGELWESSMLKTPQGHLSSKDSLYGCKYLRCFKRRWNTTSQKALR